MRDGLIIDNDEMAWCRYTPGMLAYADYVQPIVDAYAKLHTEKGIGNYDRNDILRDDFNKRARNDDGTLNRRGVYDFYRDPIGLFSRVRAYEIGARNCFSAVLNHGVTHIKNSGEYTRALNIVRARVSDAQRTPSMLDHGCGTGHSGIGFAHYGFSSILLDFDIPSFRLVADLAYQNFDGRVEGHALDANGEIPNELRVFRFDLVVTQDVLEHCVDPVATLSTLSNMMRIGGVLLMGTFFNSCAGKDPQHLSEHDKFQDCDLWFDEVDKLGFRVLDRDANGVIKLWEKIQ